MSARKDSEETHESAETLRQKEGAPREMERVGARDAAADRTETQRAESLWDRHSGGPASEGVPTAVGSRTISLVSLRL